MLTPNRPTSRGFSWPLHRKARVQTEPTSLADKVFPPVPTPAQRLRALPVRAREAWAARRPQPAEAAAARPRLADAPAFWGRVGGQSLRANGRELSVGLRVSEWLSALWHRLFVKFVRWSWRQRSSPVFGFAWRAVRKTVHAELAEMGNSFKLLGSAFLLWQKAAFKAAWWDLRRRFQRTFSPG
ncbi:MAG: hypothetical protein KIS85_05530 [Anaerolineales bacterium]|nr:hypothetical protein [Anaerolineales bacterium]